MKFKVGDKVKYYKQDNRHELWNYTDALIVGEICTVSASYYGIDAQRLELEECRNYNYYANCFKLYKNRKLKIKLP